MTQHEHIYLIDATAFCYRAFYAVRGLRTSLGRPTNAVYGFLVMLQRILQKYKPAYCAVCFDVSRATFRQEKFAAYKLQRPPAPDDLISQMPFIKDIVRAYGLPLFEKEGYEADDIIATITHAASAQGIPVSIISSDKDILQLVGGAVRVVNPAKDGDIVYDEAKVRERFGAGPEKIADIIALAGDGVDNIPGVPGIGEKTSVSLIAEYGSIESLLDRAQELKTEKLRSAILNHSRQIHLSKELACLCASVPVDCAIPQLKIGPPDYAALRRLFKHLEFKRFLKALPVSPAPDDAPPAVIADRDIPAASAGGRIYLYGSSLDSLLLGRDGKVMRAQSPGDCLKSMLADPHVHKTGHDLKTLKAALAREGAALEGVYFDTMIAAYLLNPGRAGYTLSDVAPDYLDEQTADEAQISPAKALDIIMRLAPKLAEELRAQSLDNLFSEVEMPLVCVLADMEEAGIKLDTAVLAQLSCSIEQRLSKLIEEIYESGGGRFNINSPKQLAGVLFERLKLPVVKRTKTGPSTDEEVLRSLAGKHTLPAFLLEYRQLTKLKNTYIDTLPRLADPETGRIHTSFNQTGTETGRLSSREPNLQNIPARTEIGRQIRRAIVASSGAHELIACDYSQIELRILAHLSQDAHLVEAFRAGKDVHKATASLIYGIAQEDVTGAMRDTAKRINFGIIYGLSAYGLSRDLEIGVEDAQRFIDAYFRQYAGVKEYIDRQISLAGENGYVTTLLGRRRMIGRITDENQGIRQFAQRQAVNTPVQGSASDLIKLAMVGIHSRLKAHHLRARMVLQVHDELVFDVPDAEAPEVISLARERMENVLKLDVPIKVDIKKGKNWLDMEPVA